MKFSTNVLKTTSSNHGQTTGSQKMIYPIDENKNNHIRTFIMEEVARERLFTKNGFSSIYPSYTTNENGRAGADESFTNNINIEMIERRTHPI